MTTITTPQQLIDVLTDLDVERWTKRSIYQDIKYGYTFGAANHDDLLTRKRKYAIYTYTMPDVFTINIDGELLEANKQSHVRVGDECAGLLAAYGWVDYLAGGTGAVGGAGAGDTLAQAPQRPRRSPQSPPAARQQAPDATGRAAGQAATGLV